MLEAASDALLLPSLRVPSSCVLSQNGHDGQFTCQLQLNCLLVIHRTEDCVAKARRFCWKYFKVSKLRSNAHRSQKAPFAERVSLALLGSAELDGVPRETYSMSSILRARRIRHGPRTRARPGGCAAEPGSDVTDRAAAERKRAAHEKKNTTILCNTWYIRFSIRSVCSIPIAVFEMHFM